jgi:hypothetical protein
MESQQMMEMLLKEIRAGQEEIRMNQAKIDAYQAKAEADRKADKEERKAAQVKADSHRREIKEMMKVMNCHHNETLACQETEARQEEMRASRKETAAVIEPETEVKTMACRETTRREEADLTGQETGGGTKDSGPRRKSQSNVGRRTEEETT